MGNWRDSLPSQYLKASDLQGPRLMTIKRFSTEKLGDEDKPVVFFNEDSKGLVLNIINGNSIEEIAGSPDTDEWVGKHVVLFPTDTDFKGKRVPCIRIRPPKPGAKLPEPEEFVAQDEDVPF